MFLLIMLFIICIPIFIIVYIIRNFTDKKQIKFVGPRNSGKTRTLYSLVYNTHVETVPTLENNELSYQDKIIHEIVPKPNVDFNSTYGIDDLSTKYFFFFNNEDDLVDYERGFDVYFVHCGDYNGRFREGLRDRLIILKDDTNVLLKYINAK